MDGLRTFVISLAWIAVAALHAYTQALQMSKLLIAHRGASAYAPEHTLTAYRLAIVQDADYVEQDLAVTRDGVLICLHDDSLERTTNVEEVFPQRATTDPVTGRRQWLAVDFTLAEIKQLDAGSWFDPKFAGERVPTWEEAVAAVGTMAGLYPELKTPSLYQSRGIDMTRLFAESMQRLGLTARPAGSIVVQSFDEGPLRELSKQFPTMPRTFLIEVRDGPRWLTREGLADIASFATGIGPSKILLEGQPGIVRMAHDASLTVTPYTFTTRGAPTRYADVGAEMRHYLTDLNVDALFTDNPDRFPRDAGSR
jgi:glycerophosphoryl diester phosphodiesterase